MSKKKTIEVVVPTAEEAVVLTDRLVEIEREVKKLAAEKKGIEERLEAYALAQPEEHQPLKDEKREGRKVMLRGTRFRMPVVFSSDLIIGSFQDASPKHRELLALIQKSVEAEELTTVDEEIATAHSILRKFFNPPTKWESRFDDGVQFREAVAYWLKPEVAAAFVAACRQVDKFGIAKSKTSFDFKAAVEVTDEKGGEA
jgi:hypothetical protein